MMNKFQYYMEAATEVVDKRKKKANSIASALLSEIKDKFKSSDISVENSKTAGDGKKVAKRRFTTNGKSAKAIGKLIDEFDKNEEFKVDYKVTKKDGLDVFDITVKTKAEEE